jgi:DNA-binding transcriptional ArsR family regulator
MVDVAICVLLNIRDYAIIHDNMNADRFVSPWQDGAVANEEQEAAAGVTVEDDSLAPLAVRTVEDVDILRALADPTRLAILGVLMERPDELPVMSVKELAARLGEPQTKLYRHVKQLEAVGLIRVAATRLVSGILEQRYQACQRDLQFDGGFIRAHADDSEAAMSALLDSFRAGFFAAFRDNRLQPEAVPEADRYRLPTIFYSDLRMSPAKAAEIRAKMRELMTLLSDKALEDPEGILVNVLIGYYTGPEPKPA